MTNQLCWDLFSFSVILVLSPTLSSFPPLLVLALSCPHLLLCSVLFCVVLCCSPLFSVVLCCSLLFSVVLCCSLLFFAVLCCSLLLSVVLCCSFTVHCSLAHYRSLSLLLSLVPSFLALSFHIWPSISLSCSPLLLLPLVLPFNLFFCSLLSCDCDIRICFQQNSSVRNIVIAVCSTLKSKAYKGPQPLQLFVFASYPNNIFGHIRMGTDL